MEETNNFFPFPFLFLLDLDPPGTKKTPETSGSGIPISTFNCFQMRTDTSQYLYCRSGKLTSGKSLPHFIFERKQTADL